VAGFIVIRNAVGRFIFYDRTVATGRQKLPVARDFDRLFPNTQHFISYYPGISGEPKWNAIAGLHGRYILTAQFKIRIRRSDGEIVAWDPPEFWLNEVQRIDGPASQRTYISYDRAGHVTFGPEEWQLVVERGGDLSVLGKELKKDQPVAGFENVWRTGG
jgi:hypothetical protein